MQPLIDALEDPETRWSATQARAWCQAELGVQASEQGRRTWNQTLLQWLPESNRLRGDAPGGGLWIHGDDDALVVEAKSVVEKMRESGVLGDEAPAEAGGALGWGGEIGGLILLALSLVFMIGGWQLGLGVPTRVGTGAFPFMAGAILAVLAVVICIEERKGDGIAERPDWIALLAIGAALAIFAASAERIGLVPATFLAVIVASLPDRSLR